MKLKSKQQILSKTVFRVVRSVCCKHRMRNLELRLSFEIFFDIEII